MNIIFIHNWSWFNPEWWYIFWNRCIKTQVFPYSYCFLATMPMEKPGQVPDTQRRTGGFGEPRAVFTGVGWASVGRKEYPGKMIMKHPWLLGTSILGNPHMSRFLIWIVRYYEIWIDMRYEKTFLKPCRGSMTSPSAWVSVVPRFSMCWKKTSPNWLERSKETCPRQCHNQKEC